MIIRQTQIDELSSEMKRGFEDEMVAHLADFSPPLYKVIKEDQMREVVRFGMKQADRYGLALRGPIRLYLEMMLLFGSYFDNDPQYSWAGEILIDRHSVSEMQRAEWLHEKILDYQEKVSGPDGANTRKALEKMHEIGNRQVSFPSNDFIPSLRQEMYKVFPEKAEYVGKDNLTALIREGKSDARKLNLPSTRGETVLTVLKYAFGHGCANDPLYPWIGRTLRDDRIVSPEARVDRLEKKSMTWLEHVLTGEEVGDLA